MIALMLVGLTAAPTSAPRPSSLCRGHTWRIWTDMEFDFDDDGDAEDGDGGDTDDDDDDVDEGNLLEELKSVTTDEV